MKTSIPNKEQQQDKKWFIVDAEGKVLGRLATKVADVLRGKHKASFTPHLDMGDHVIIVNADKLRFTGAKGQQKRYYRHSGYSGNLKSVLLDKMMEKAPLKVLESAISGMLPKNKLRSKFMEKLHLYQGAEHKHEAQKPQELKV